MAIWSYAQWMPVKTKQEPRRDGADPKGLILHITGARTNSLGGILATFSPGGDNPFPSHFGIQTDGKVGQFIDTKYHDWAEEWSTGYVSVECSASRGDSLTYAQVSSVASLYAWLSMEYTLPLVEANKSGDPGLGYHSMGKTSHTFCPGPNVLRQRSTILSLAETLVILAKTPLGVPVIPFLGF